MELASGSGRVTLPLARAAASLPSPIDIVGLEREAPILEEALRKREASTARRARVSP